jgi:hypothetical protein
MFYISEAPNGTAMVSSIPPEEGFYVEMKTLPEGDGALYLDLNGTVYRIPDPPKLTPSELREQAYNSEAVISWEDSMITVTKASQLWQYYAAEGNLKATILQELISDAKTDIRLKYPD